MLKAIIAREFLNNLLNLRFMIGLVLCVIITVACIVILTNDYKHELAEYNLRVNRRENILDNYASRRILWGMLMPYKPPARFRPLIIGAQSENSESFDYNSLSVLFPTLDFLFIVTIVLSLLAVLFSYDAVTEERQSGTLRLVVANSVSRVKILLGKLIGGAASLLIPFVLSLLVGAFYISISSQIEWDGSAWLEFLLLTAASMTFIVLFYLLGLMVSTLSRNSSTSILTCLFIWILFILVIPNMCPYISAQICRIPSIKETERLRGAYEREGIKLIGQYRNEIRKKYRTRYGKSFLDYESMEPEAVKQRVASDFTFRSMVEAFRKELEETNIPSVDDLRSMITKLRDDFKTRTKVQTKLARNLTCISPYSNYLYLAMDLTGTGLHSSQHFTDLVNQHKKDQLIQYMYQVEEDAKKNDPTYTEDTILNVDDRPHFVFKEEPLKGKLYAALPYWGVLGLFNVLFFVAAFAGFMRYDVR